MKYVYYDTDGNEYSFDVLCRHDAIQEIIDTLEQIRDDLIDPDVGVSTANLHIDDAIGLVRGLEEE